jgi:hypothetical protein
MNKLITGWGRQITHTEFWWETSWNSSLGRLRKWEDNINMDFMKRHCDDQRQMKLL